MKQNTTKNYLSIFPISLKLLKEKIKNKRQKETLFCCIDTRFSNIKFELGCKGTGEVLSLATALNCPHLQMTFVIVFFIVIEINNMKQKRKN